MIPTGRLRRAVHDRSGATAIEFALVFPVFVVVLAGVLAYGLYFGAANSVQQLAANAARASVAGVSDAERATIARDHVARTASSYVMLDAARASVNARPSLANPNVFEVAVVYDASRLPIWAFSGLLPLPSRTIIRTAAIQRGGY